MRVLFLGCGKMGQALMRPLLIQRGLSVSACTRSAAAARELRRRFKISMGSDARAAVAAADVILLAVKPAQAETLLRSLRTAFSKRQLLISICAGLETSQLSRWSGGRAAIVRAMPNTPALVGEGMTALCAGPRCAREHLESARRIFEASGQVEIVAEDLLDAVTGLSGCGPAYIFTVIEALTAAGLRVGLKRPVAEKLAAQTLLGSARLLLKTDRHPAELRDEVLTPGGCAVRGMHEIEKGGLRATLINAVVAATARSKELGRKR